MKKYIIAALFLSTASYGAGFDCKLAKSIKEKTICDEYELSNLDSELNRKYKKYVDYSAEGDRLVIKSDQISWLKAQSKECDERSSELKACLLNSYSSRLKYLKEKYGFFKLDMVQNVELANFVKSRKELDMQFLPDYIPIAEKIFLIPIDWGQASRRHHGVYLADLKKGLFKNVAEGFPSIDGIYNDKDIVVLVLKSHSDLRGIGRNIISVLTIKSGVVNKNNVVDFSYNSSDGVNPDDCPNDESGGPLRISQAGVLKNISISDLNGDGIRDVIVEYGIRDCASNVYSNNTSNYIIE
jgi:uncharacterized protein